MALFFVSFTVIAAVFLLFHLRFFYSGDLPRNQNADPRDPTYWAMLAAFALVLASLVAEMWVHTPDRTTASMWAGRILVVISAGWTIWSRKVLGASYAPTAKNLDPDQRLVTAGPYRWMKHPVYVGNIGTVAGLCLAFDLKWSWLAFLAMALSIYWRIREEERFLKNRFAEYR